MSQFFHRLKLWLTCVTSTTRCKSRALAAANRSDEPNSASSSLLTVSMVVSCEMNIQKQIEPYKKGHSERF